MKTGFRFFVVFFLKREKPALHIVAEFLHGFLRFNSTCIHSIFVLIYHI